MKILVFGYQGWIASHFIPILERENFIVICASARADDPMQVSQELDVVKPDRVVSLIGRTHGDGINTIDYLEQPGKLQENIRDNLFAPLVIQHACKERGIYFAYIGTGCIFNYDDPTTCIDKLYNEQDIPDFFGSSYSIVKGFTDRLMHLHSDNTLNVRIRMPITGALNDHRDFISKITKYERICSMPNSMSVLPSLLPLLADMIRKKQTGTINLVNPGYITHNEILELYKTYVDPDFTWTNFSIEEQDAILASKRSNNVLDTTCLQLLYPSVPDILRAVEKCLFNRNGDLSK